MPPARRSLPSPTGISRRALHLAPVEAVLRQRGWEVHVLGQVAARLRQRLHAGGLVQVGVGVLAAQHAVGEQAPRERAEGHAGAGEAGGHPDVPGEGRAPDEGEPVGRLDHLARPAIVDLRAGEALPGPGLQRLEARLRVRLVADLVVLAAHHQEGPGARLLAAHVVVGLLAVVVEPRGRQGLHPQREGVGAVGRDLGVEGELRRHRVVRRHEHVGAADGALRGLDPAGVALVDLHRPRVLVEEHPRRRQTVGEAEQVLARVELRLVLHPQHGGGRLQQAERQVVGHCRRHPRLAQRLQLLFQLLALLFPLRPAEGRHALEAAGDPLGPGQLLDVVDGRPGGGGGQDGLLPPEVAPHGGVAAVEQLGEVGGGVAGVLRRQAAGLQHGHPLPLPPQEPGGGETGDTPADDAGVDLDFAGEGRAVRRLRGGQPEGLVERAHALTLLPGALGGEVRPRRGPAHQPGRGALDGGPAQNAVTPYPR